MNIPADQVSYKKNIGTLDGTPVWEVGTRGGLHLVVSAKHGKAETLGCGSHRAIARHIAMKREPDIKLTELAKSDFVALEHFQHLLPRYEELTNAYRRVGGFEE